MNKKYKNMEERLVANSVINENGCWVWVGKKNYRGYPQLTVREYGVHLNKYAHRLSVEVLKGEHIPPEHQVDHRCKNPACINPDHLEIVTMDENLRRRKGYDK